MLRLLARNRSQSRPSMATLNGVGEDGCATSSAGFGPAMMRQRLAFSF